MKRSDGLLAPTQGAERLLTMGTGHTTAGIRGSFYKCKAGVPSIMGTDGKLDLTIQRAKDPALDVMHTRAGISRSSRTKPSRPGAKSQLSVSRPKNTQNNVGIHYQLFFLPPDISNLLLSFIFHHFYCGRYVAI